MTPNHQIKPKKTNQPSTVTKTETHQARPLHRILQLQKAVGNRAMMQMLAQQKTASQQPPVQMKKLSEDVAETYSELLLDILEEVSQVEGTNSQLYADLYKFFNAVDSDLDEKDFNQWAQWLLTTYKSPLLAQLGGVGRLTHPSGLADSNGVLSPSITKIRSYMYPSGYNSTAKQHFEQERNKQKVKKNVTWRCPFCGQKREWDDATIDHITPCAKHWNQEGYNQTRAERNQWYNDTSNHQCMCGSCNSSYGSGGIYYSRMVGPNFRN